MDSKDIFMPNLSAKIAYFFFTFGEFQFSCEMAFIFNSEQENSKIYRVFHRKIKLRKPGENGPAYTNQNNFIIWIT